VSELRASRPATAAPLTLEPVSRSRAAYTRRLRAGIPGGGHGRGSVPTGFRNDLPVSRPYAYGGTGEDIYLGTYGDEWLDRPYDF
jgi:hypothetical protein